MPHQSQALRRALEIKTSDKIPPDFNFLIGCFVAYMTVAAAVVHWIGDDSDLHPESAEQQLVDDGIGHWELSKRINPEFQFNPSQPVEEESSASTTDDM